MRQLVPAEGRLAAPDCEHRIAVDADLLFDAVECRFVADEQLTAFGGKFFEIRLVEILVWRAGELGLTATVGFGLTGQFEIGQRQIGFVEATDGGIERRAADALCLGLGPQIFEKSAKSGIGRRVGLSVGRACEKPEQKDRRESPQRKSRPIERPKLANPRSTHHPFLNCASTLQTVRVDSGPICGFRIAYPRVFVASYPVSVTRNPSASSSPLLRVVTA